MSRIVSFVTAANGIFASALVSVLGKAAGVALVALVAVGILMFWGNGTSDPASNQGPPNTGPVVPEQVSVRTPPR